MRSTQPLTRVAMIQAMTLTATHVTPVSFPPMSCAPPMKAGTQQTQYERGGDDGPGQRVALAEREDELRWRPRAAMMMPAHRASQPKMARGWRGKSARLEITSAAPMITSVSAARPGKRADT